MTFADGSERRGESRISGMERTGVQQLVKPPVGDADRMVQRGLELGAVTWVGDCIGESSVKITYFCSLNVGEQLGVWHTDGNQSCWGLHVSKAIVTGLTLVIFLQTHVGSFLLHVCLRCHPFTCLSSCLATFVGPTSEGPDAKVRDVRKRRSIPCS